MCNTSDLVRYALGCMVNHTYILFSLYMFLNCNVNLMDRASCRKIYTYWLHDISTVYMIYYVSAYQNYHYGIVANVLALLECILIYA